LSYLQLLITPYASNPEILHGIQNIDSIYIALVVGIIGAAILQSSGAVTVLAITFAVSGILNFDQAFGIVVGSSIGTTVTALIASIVMNTAAQKTAFAHLWFNVVSAIITILLFSPVKNMVLSWNTSIGQSIANAHLIVCTITGIFLLIGFKWYVRFIDFIIPEKGLFHKARKAIETSI
jgi:phosphate:Na+ symporter